MSVRNLVFTSSLVISALFATSGRSEKAPGHALEVVRSFTDFKLVGIAVSRSGRIFASAPGATRGDRLIEVATAGGADHAYPDPSWQNPGAAKKEAWYAPQALWVDDRDHLWVLDSGRNTPPIGEPKLVEIDLASDKVQRIYDFGSILNDKDSLNDLRIDLEHRFAYITNAGSNGSLVVLDLASGKSRQLLIGDRSTRADARDQLRIGGQTALYRGKPLSVQADGIAMSANNEWLYYRTLSDRNYWRIPTAVLRDASLSEQEIAAKVQFLGRGKISGGLVMDRNGSLYGGDLERGSVVKMTPRFGATTMMSRTIIDAPVQLAWPDGFAISGGYLYIADARLSESAFNNSLPKRGIPTIFKWQMSPGQKSNSKSASGK